ncbi:MAG: PAS domain-containing protein [Acidobacteriota bacterium]|nr:PAS domain-containing protein [Acidobacteriota bacterium]
MPDFLKNITPTELQFAHYALLILITLCGVAISVLGWIFGKSWLKEKVIAVLKSPWTAIKLFYHAVNFPAEFAAYRKESAFQFQVINSQLVRNGGSSMRDSVDRIEQNQVFLTNKMRYEDDRATEALFEIKVNSDVPGQPAFTFSYVNPALCKMLGFPANHLLEMNLISKIEEQERETFLGLLNIALKTGSRLESRHHIQHGERKELMHVKFVAQPQRDAHGRLSHYYGHLEPATRTNA